MCFPVNFAKFLRTPFLADYLLWLLLQPATLLKKRFPQKCFFCEFGGTLLDDCFLSLSVNFEKFFRTSLLQSTSEKLLISCTSCSISTSRYSEELFHRCYSSIVYKNTGSSHSKAFIYSKSLKRLICNEAARCQHTSLRKKSFTYLPSCILPSFSKNASRLLLPKRL